MPSLEEVLDEHIPRMAAILKRAGGAPPIDADFIDEFAETLRSFGCTVEEFLAAKRVILATEEWFPAPATFLNVVRKGREAAEARWKRHMMTNLVLALDSEGVERLCYRGWVHNGRIIPEGKRSSFPEGWKPNGRSLTEVRALDAPSESHEERVKRAESGVLALFAAATGCELATAELRRREEPTPGLLRRMPGEA